MKDAGMTFVQQPRNVGPLKSIFYLPSSSVAHVKGSEANPIPALVEAATVIE